MKWFIQETILIYFERQTNIQNLISMSTENFNTKIYIKDAGYAICKLKKLYIKLQKWINKVNKKPAIFLQSKWRTTS